MGGVFANAHLSNTAEVDENLSLHHGRRYMPEELVHRHHELMEHDLHASYQPHSIDELEQAMLLRDIEQDHDIIREIRGAYLNL